MVYNSVRFHVLTGQVSQFLVTIWFTDGSGNRWERQPILYSFESASAPKSKDLIDIVKNSEGTSLGGYGFKFEISGPF